MSSSTKFWAYADINYRLERTRSSAISSTYPMFNKYGAVNLGEVAGGVRLFWAESVAGVINWALAAPLFSINYVLLSALLDRTLRPLRRTVQRAGREALVAQAVRVLRWGLWMAPIINTFLRQSPDPDLVQPGRRGAHAGRDRRRHRPARRELPRFQPDDVLWACSPTIGCA